MVVCGLCSYPPDVRFINTNQHVLRLDVGVDYLTLGVHVVQSLQHLRNNVEIHDFDNVS